MGCSSFTVDDKPLGKPPERKDNPPGIDFLWRLGWRGTAIISLATMRHGRLSNARTTKQDDVMGASGDGYHKAKVHALGAYSRLFRLSLFIVGIDGNRLAALLQAECSSTWFTLIPLIELSDSDSSLLSDSQSYGRALFRPIRYTSAPPPSPLT
ncbi:hypothetical protein LIPSTDRAFT_2844 [Lipomyces starkeyi NRRL Y-11557]|uniref:Uncharacterized protein n=1 Tax=Lipomyces starkeyi NRRL Y-11557 TaxID=675824 RepID=A0A1E3Q7M9_LIPST|nr:hypothetical protein LIPSTDRAFT_2844 [Lipomyces starkeyi NRRL Y-11557]